MPSPLLMKVIGINNKVRCFHLLAFGLVMLSCSLALGQTVDVKKLSIDETIERKLKGGVEGHFYTVTLKQGQVLRIDVRQKGVDVLVVVGKNEKEKVIAASDLGFAFERETLTFIVDQDHTYLVLVRSPLMNTSGSYQLMAEIKDAATAADRDRIQAELLLAEGRASKDTGNANGLREAIRLLEKALLLWEKSGDKYWEGFTSHQLGMVYFDLGETQKALSYYRRALPLRRAAGDEDGEGTTLNNIGLLYSDAGERREALNYYQRGLLLLRAAGDTISEATALNDIGATYDDLGEKLEARKYYTQARLLYEKLGNKDGQAMTLNNIGKIYVESGNKVMGRLLLYQALALTREIGSKIGEAAVLNNINSALGPGDSGEDKGNLDDLTKSLQLTRDIGNRSAEAVMLSNIGFAYVQLGDNQKGLDYFTQALPLLRAVNDRQREAETLNNKMVVWERLGNRRLAIFYGKQAVNKFQGVRGLAQGIDNEMQKTFLRNVQPYYQILVQIMVMEGQSEQAVQILNLYRDQEFFDFNRDANSPVRQTVFSPREEDFAKRYETTIERVGDVSSQIERLKREIANLQPNDQKAMALKGLEAELKTASEEFQAVLKQAEKEFSKPLDNRDTVADVPDVTQLRSMLNQLNRDTGQKTTAVYTVVGKTEFHALIVTEHGVNSVSVPIKGVALNNKARQLWALLRTTDYDPTKLSNDLYNTIFKPIEGKLPKDTKTILWSLDGNLRYIPMAALHDSKQYRGERFSHVIFTRPDTERLTRAVSPTLTGYGFASSAPRLIEVGGKQIDFGPLDFVRDEMQIFRTKSFPKGTVDGEVFIEDKFTKASLLAALKQRKRPLVHISSHFRFRPGDPASSFLLLGDGKIMTLAEMKEYAGLFEDVELLTLSACDTAAQLPDATGREIDTFAELAQRLGAAAVMASLWPVSDPSTAQQMKVFYQHRQSGKTKAEALRKAQLDLLYGKNEDALLPGVTLGNTKGGATSSEEIFVEENYRITFKMDQKKPFAHPYYWSPFILFGNWR